MDSLGDNICHFRHALALNEKRVKFLPEYGRGGDTFDSEGDEDQDQHITKKYKEVWFFGSHSDVYVIFLSPCECVLTLLCQLVRGGKNLTDGNFGTSSIPALWMANESIACGLRLKPSTKPTEWSLAAPTDSMKPLYRILEYLPITHLTYRNTIESVRYDHCTVSTRQCSLFYQKTTQVRIAYRQAEATFPHIGFCPKPTCFDERSY